MIFLSPFFVLARLRPWDFSSEKKTISSWYSFRIPEQAYIIEICYRTSVLGIIANVRIDMNDASYAWPE